MSLYNNYEEVASWEDLDALVRRMPPSRSFTNIMVTPHLPEGSENHYPWKNGEAVMFLGEILHMQGHGIFVGKDGLVRFGYHTSSFKVIPKDEL